MKETTPQMIQRIIKEELQLEAAPKIKVHAATKAITDIIAKLGSIGRQLPNTSDGKATKSQISASIKSLQKAREASQRISTAY